MDRQMHIGGKRKFELKSSCHKEKFLALSKSKTV
jgi:hypothetical protein